MKTSLESIGRTFATEESRASSDPSQRTRSKPTPVYALDVQGGWWRCDLDGYIAWDTVNNRPRRGARPIGLAAFRRLALATPEQINARDVPYGARPHGQWRRYINTTSSPTGPQLTFDHFLYGRCVVIATDGVHAIIETFGAMHWTFDPETGRPTASRGGECFRTEVMFANLTQRPLEQPPVVRNIKCPQCGHVHPTYFDACPECSHERPKRGRTRATHATPTLSDGVDWSLVDLDLLG